MNPWIKLTSRCVVLPMDRIDTDQIIPARFLKDAPTQDLAKGLFADGRYKADGTLREDCVLNTPQASGAQILVAGPHVGCGSSREHAVWALMAFGFQAVVSPLIADIFYTNALKNGLLPVVVTPAMYQRLLKIADGNVTLDLQRCCISLPDGSTEAFPIEPFARYCLLEGIDELDFLLKQEAALAAYEARTQACKP